jgi:hypothetical protein
MTASYAVLFKTHFWDDFNRRQLARLRERVKSGDLYVVIDETFAPAPAIEGERIIGITKADLAALNLAPITTHGSIIWYNNDYPNYVAAAKLPPYDYYVSIEYDVTVTIEFDDLIERLAKDNVDFLAFPIRKPARDWPWYPMHEALYGPDMQVNLSCLAVYSTAALAALLARRQAHGLAFAAGSLTYWPHVEGFLPNEIIKAGLKPASLAAYGHTEAYDWWPPMNEAHLAAAPAQSFIHPVLHGNRFVRSTIYHEPSALNLLRKNSLLHQKLKEFPATMVNPLIRAEIKRRCAGKLYRIAERLHLLPKWFDRARSGVATGRQEELPHNAK